jgi:hypothetical protein
MKHPNCSLLTLLLLTAASFAQQRPTLTTEDVVRWRVVNPERAEHFIPKPPATATSQKKSPSQAEAEFLAAEKDWNARLAQARARVRDFERRANQSELSASQARNVIFHNDPQALNANNTRVAEWQELARAYRYEARRGQDAVHRLLDEGRQYGYQLTYIAPRLPNGEPNLEYYRTRFLELQAELQDAQAQANVAQLRTNRVQTSINMSLSDVRYYPFPGRGFLFYPNNGAGDAFYLNRLRSDLTAVGGKLSAAQTRVAILTAQLADLEEEGRRAGVPPGVFR